MVVALNHIKLYVKRTLTGFFILYVINLLLMFIIEKYYEYAFFFKSQAKIFFNLTYFA